MSPYELRTERLLLRPFRAADATRIFEFANHPDYRRYLGPDHPDPDGFVAHNLGVDWVREHAWVICEGGTVVGSIFLGVTGFSGVSGFPGVTGGRAELACLLDPAHFARGIATEAATAVLDHAFSTLGLEQVYAHADAANTASIKGMERLGMTPTKTDGTRVTYVRNRPDSTP